MVNGNIKGKAGLKRFKRFKLKYEFKLLKNPSVGLEVVDIF